MKFLFNKCRDCAGRFILAFCFSLRPDFLAEKKQGIMRYQAPKIGQALPLFLRACPVIGPSFTALSSLVQG